MHALRRGCLLALCGVVFATACGDGTPRVPTGDPLEVVHDSADLTEQAGQINVYVDAPGESVNAVVDLVQGSGPAEVRERALSALDVIRKAAKAVAYGGQQIRGVSTMRYDVTPRGGGEIDVWVSVDGMVRRAQLPDGPVAEAPPIQDNGLPGFVTIDFVYPSRPVIAGPPDL